MFNHLHIGAGALGLGLVVPALSPRADRCLILNRRGQSNSDESFLKCETLRSTKNYVLEDERGETRHQFEQFLYLYEDLPQDFQGENCVITTSVKDGALDRDFLIDLASIIEACAQKHTLTIVISCENRTRSIDLKAKLDGVEGDSDRTRFSWNERNVVFVNALVDRVCQTPTTEAFEKVRVRVAESFSFLVESNPDTRAVLKTCVSLESQDHIDCEYAKKIILLNLSHALISIWALREGYANLDIYLKVSREGKHILHGILSELLGLIEYRHPKLDASDLVSYASDVHIRFVETPDRVDRIIKRFDGPLSISNFIKDIWFKGIQDIEGLEFSSYEQFPYLLGTLVQLMSLIAEDSYVGVPIE